MPNAVAKALGEAVLRRMAGERSFERGRDYFAHGHVVSLDISAASANAVVRGGDDYAIELSIDEGILDYRCDCPVGSDGQFCKHCVAAALSWAKELAPSKSKRRRKRVRLEDAEVMLRREEKDAIVERLLEWAKSDAVLRERLLMLAARKAGPEAARAEVENTFRKAAHIRDFVDYRQVRGYVRGIHEAIDHFDELLREGQPATVAELCEWALAELEGNLQVVDDSDGRMRGLLDRLENLHLDACEQAPPEPVSLAKRLFERSLRSEYDVFSNVVSRYASILGPAGLQAFREMAEAVWAKVPALGPGDTKDWGKHFQITQIMGELAEIAGDLDMKVSVLSRDLSSSYSYVSIAEEYRQAGEHGQAMEWAEKGLKAFPKRPDGRLRVFLAEEFQRDGRRDEAMKLLWAEFLEGPRLDAYRRLEEFARPAGDWAEWRERALGEIRRKIEERSAEGGRRSQWDTSYSDHSDLVEIFLHEGDVDAAWEEAQAGGCQDGLWVRLAELRAEDHPDEAAAVYFTQAEDALQYASNSNYRVAVDLLLRAKPVMVRDGKNDVFLKWLEVLTNAHRRKTNFLKLLDKNREALYTT